MFPLSGKAWIMEKPSTAELQQLARDVMGLELEAAEAEAYRSRLPAVARAIRTLEAWAGRLGEVEPAVVHRVPEPPR
jgi:hypothetical protein